MSLSVTFIRHARSEANEANIWQGQGDSPLSPHGRRQVELLGERLAGYEFDLAVASDLTRTRQTAQAAGTEVESDPGWREMDLGGWEGRSFEDVAEEHPDLLEAIRSGEAVKFGATGETIHEFEERIIDAFDRLVARLDGAGTALVVTHGGVIDVIVGRALGRSNGRRTYPIVTNTSLTRLSTAALWRNPDALRIQTFNDATHLGHDVGFLGRMRAEGIPVVGLVRHGVTEANKAHRIQGHSCWGLDDEGREQARRLARWYGPIDRVLSSPTPRAAETATLLANGAGVECFDELMEMGFGEWEGRYYEDLMDGASDELARRIFVDGDDLPRGRTGESFAMVRDRLAPFLAGLDLDPSKRTVAVSHGAAIKSVVAAIIGRGVDINDGLATPLNGSVSHVAYTAIGPMLADFSVTPPTGLS